MKLMLCVPSYTCSCPSLLAHPHKVVRSLAKEHAQGLSWASLVAQWYGICLPMQETWVGSLGWEDPLQEEMATHYSILAWEIPWTDKPGGYRPWVCKESDTTEQPNKNNNKGLSWQSSG